MYIQGISNKLVNQIAEVEPQALWSLHFRDGHIECEGVQIAPESNVEIIHEPGWNGGYHSYLSFNRCQGQSLLVLDFSLTEEPNKEMVLNLIGAANACDTKLCYFSLRINGEFVQEFRAIDDYIGNGWRGDTHVSISPHVLHQGNNTIEIEMTGHGFPGYMLWDISLTERTFLRVADF